MARLVHDSNLETRTARSRLDARGKPYYRAVEPGLHLGYRKPQQGAGKWVARHYVAYDQYQVETLAIADDLSDPDGVAILDYRQALNRARERMVAHARTRAGEPHRAHGPLTVTQAMEAYIELLENDGRPESAIKDVKSRNRAFIEPKLGDNEVAALTSKRLKRWRDDLAKSAPRLRTRKGEAQKHREIDDDDADGRRARRATTNRTWTVLRAALNLAFANGEVASDAPWRQVKPFRNVERARVRYLTIAEANRLINASDTEFRPLLQGALLSGARYGQLAGLIVSDFNPDVGTLRLRTRKGDGSEKIYFCQLTEEGVRFFKEICAGRSAGALIFSRADGTPWLKSHQVRPIEKASARAKITPSATFHVARHTWASHAVMNGTPLIVVAKNLGHTDTRMVELHYGHLAPSYVAEAIRAGAPRYGLKAGNVTSL